MMSSMRAVPIETSLLSQSLVTPCVALALLGAFGCNVFDESGEFKAQSGDAGADGARSVDVVDGDSRDTFSNDDVDVASDAADCASPAMWYPDLDRDGFGGPVGRMAC